MLRGWCTVVGCPWRVPIGSRGLVELQVLWGALSGSESYRRSEYWYAERWDDVQGALRV